MQSYEKEQQKLEKYWQEILSDEESDEFGDTYLSDEYQPTDSSDSENESSTPEQNKKRKRVAGNTKPLGQDVSASTSKEKEYTNFGEHVDAAIESVVAQHSEVSEQEILEEPIVSNAMNEAIVWGPVNSENLQKFTFEDYNSAGFHTQLYENFYNKSPFQFYEYFVDDGLLSMMVEETNRYALQCQERNQKKGARITAWHNTDVAEIKGFLGIVIWMGLCHFPSFHSYWSKNDLYVNNIKKVMSRNRFQLLWKTLHFNDNSVTTDDRLQKIVPLVSRLKDKFKAAIVPKENVCIDETLVPFQGRLKFKQYIANKRHKFGIKLFKLCLEGGYTYDFNVYCGKEHAEGSTVPTNVVMKLMDGLLDKGRTLAIDNYYSSVTLAHELLHRKTYMIGTLRANRKYNPKNVISKKLKVGEHVAEQSNSGIVVQKWRDKRDVLMISTKFADEMVTMQKARGDVVKPKNVIEYNKYKSFIDISDQMKSYNSPLRKGIKWYRKLSMELLTGTALINAYVAHQSIANESMTITKFKEEVIRGLLGDFIVTPVIMENSHKLSDVGRAGRRRCTTCYAKMVEEEGRQVAQRKATNTSLTCDGCKKFYCLGCFFVIHSVTKN